MSQSNYVYSSLKWTTTGIKEQLRRIELDLEKIKNTKLGRYNEIQEIEYLVKRSENLFLEFGRNIMSYESLITSKVSLRKLYELYFVRSLFYIKKAFDVFSFLKNEEEIHQSILCRDVYTKIYKLLLLFDEEEAKYKILVNMAK